MSFRERWRRILLSNDLDLLPLPLQRIRVKCLSQDPLVYRTTLKKHFWNQNAVGTHFGGSLYSMTDPFYMLIMMEALGTDYIVWDQASKIEFIKAGKKPVSALFELLEHSD